MEVKIDDFEVPVLTSIINLANSAKKFTLGIKWSHFFSTYILKHVSSKNNFSKINTLIEKQLCIAVDSLRKNNIEPIFIMNGIISDFLSYSFSVILEGAIKYLMSMNVHFVYAPCDANSQLAYFYQNKYINAAFTDYNISLLDVPQWISYIDFSSLDCVVSKATKETLDFLLKNCKQITYFCCPYIKGDSIEWFNKINSDMIPQNVQLNINAINCICAGLITAPRIPRPPRGPSFKTPLITLPRNCCAYLNDISDLYISIFRNFSKLDLSEIMNSNDAPRIDEFLPLMLQQNPLTTPIEVNDTIFSSVLAAQNIVQRSFTTLFETMRSISTSESVSVPLNPEELRSRVIAEATRRYLTAHEYIAPGGGLSPWGRAILNTNAGNDIPTMYFIEMVRGDAMDAEVDSIPEGGVGVADIIERTFMLYPTKTKPPENAKPRISTFQTIVQIIANSLHSLYKIIIADTYYGIAPNPSIEELAQFMNLPFLSYTDYQTGTLMRFILEASEDRLEEFADNVEDFEQLQKDVRNAFNWWNGLQRGTKELKQRSLKPNSRVSNLKNFLILFDCANQFVQKRMAQVAEILDLL